MQAAASWGAGVGQVADEHCPPPLGLVPATWASELTHVNVTAALSPEDWRCPHYDPQEESAQLCMGLQGSTRASRSSGKGSPQPTLGCAGRSRGSRLPSASRSSASRAGSPGGEYVLGSPQRPERLEVTAAMPGPWLLLALALTLTLAGVPGGRTQPDVAEQEAASPERPGLDDLLRQAERLLLREDLQLLRAGLPDLEPESQLFQPNWLLKRQHPGKREEAEEGSVEEEEGGAAGPHKRQHPGRRASWLGHILAKRQHPGRRLADAKPQGWDEREEEPEEEAGELTPEKRQHPGKRALGGLCGPWRACGQASLLLGLLDDLSRAQAPEQKRQHPGRRASLLREPLAP
ncbi:Pro-thyrotropin-releasing hormone [Galemys pyrenaicus]|uniref:Pro-thyrotropin-releasing hormone n=1 Tax=Galemys pyrenaicus TaxID=202257 RepID=A0A8J6DQH7_GALPY|nr:Pro-thyrotropin-releasing hormone [Galemys pyrenaicus]